MNKKEEVAYNRGKSEFLQGVTADDCPYQGHMHGGKFNELRRCWFDGFYEQQILKNTGVDVSRNEKCKLSKN